MSASLILRRRTLEPADWPVVMGVLNVTPDSFSDGGEFVNPEAAIARATQMIDEGAAVIDVGPESTRPGSMPVSAHEQMRRAVPVLRGVRERFPDAAISIDTRLASVAEAAIAAGADMVNDVSALRDDPQMVDLVARTGVPVVLMHCRGTPADMQKDGGPSYEDVVLEIKAFLRERIAFASAAGISLDRILVDPGIGFGKRVEHNLSILNRLDEIAALGFPILIGASRKSFLGAILKTDDPKDRLAGSITAALIAAEAGAAIIRVHDVRETVETLSLWKGVRNYG